MENFCWKFLGNGMKKGKFGYGMNLAEIRSGFNRASLLLHLARSRLAWNVGCKVLKNKGLLGGKCLGKWEMVWGKLCPVLYTVYGGPDERW
jgi:hypothetical protein